MNLDELQSVKSRERQASDLQELRDSFYEDAAEFVRDLREERQRVVREDGIDSASFERLSNDIETAERAVESIYERRVGKVVKMASIAAADMPTEEAGLTDEERELFETLVADIRDNRHRVFAALEPDRAHGGGSQAGDDRGPEPEPTVPDDGSGADEGNHSSDERGPPEASPGSPDIRADEHTGTTDTSGGSTSTRERGAGHDIQRATLRITEDVGEILGVDQRAYHLASEDVVTLPEANAGPLVEQGAAERIE